MRSGDRDADDPEPEEPDGGEDEGEPAFTEVEEPSVARESDPFAELDAEATAAGAGPDDPDDAFEEMEVDDVEAEAVWETLAEDEEPGPAPDPEPPDEPVDRVVDKRQYCQRCPHFTEPPEVACGHEGTEIVEVVNSDEFRVRNCPMIGEQGPAFDTS